MTDNSKIHIRIMEDATVLITDRDGKPLPYKTVDGPLAVEGKVRIDAAFWYAVNPTCVVHNGKRYCV